MSFLEFQIEHHHLLIAMAFKLVALLFAGYKAIKYKGELSKAEDKIIAIKQDGYEHSKAAAEFESLARELRKLNCHVHESLEQNKESLKQNKRSLLDLEARNLELEKEIKLYQSYFRIKAAFFNGQYFSLLQVKSEKQKRYLRNKINKLNTSKNM